MKKVIGVVLAAVMLVGLLGGAVTAYAADQPGANAQVLAAASDTVSPDIAGAGNFVQWQQGYFEKWQELLKLRAECDALRTEIQGQYATLDPLVKAARDNHERGKLDRLQPLMTEIKALESANAAIATEKDGLWKQFYQAIWNGHFGQANFLFDQIVRDKTLIVANLARTSDLLARAIAIFE